MIMMKRYFFHSLLIMGISCQLLAVSCELYAGQRGFRLYKSDTSGSYTYGSGYAVASSTRWERMLSYENPTQGTWYFVLTAWHTGLGGTYESGPSNEVSADLDASESVLFVWDEYFWSVQRLIFHSYSTGQITGGGLGSMKLEK